MRALVEDKEAYLPRLKLVICWFQHYALSGLSESDDDMTYDNLTYNSKQLGMFGASIQCCWCPI